MISSKLPIEELYEIMVAAKVLQIMGLEHKHRVTVDYVPSRAAIIYPREEDDEAMELMPQTPRTLTFVLEEQMFGGEVYAAVTCEGRTVLAPFLWRSYEHLAAMRTILKERS